MQLPTHAHDRTPAAANYRGGRSEATLGRALSLLLAGSHMADFRGGSATVTRDALFISTKVRAAAPFNMY